MPDKEEPEEKEEKVNGFEDEIKDQESLPDLVNSQWEKSPDQEDEEVLKKFRFLEERSFHSKVDTDELIASRGPWVFELYAVLIHSGSALGGHYYAYIRNFKDGKWYNFNDSCVDEIDITTVSLIL